MRVDKRVKYCVILVYVRLVLYDGSQGVEFAWEKNTVYQDKQVKDGGIKVLRSAWK